MNELNARSVDVNTSSDSKPICAMHTVNVAKNINLYVDKPWLSLDVAATLYAGARTKDWARTYRNGFILDEEVDPVILQQALDDTAKRFPTFCMKLRDGLFWSYFERTHELPKLVPDTKYPYRPIQLEGNEQPCFRILYYKNRVTLEAFHSLSDGMGGAHFLCTLIARYFELKGENIPKCRMISDVSERETVEQAQDSHFVHYDASCKAKNCSQVEVYRDESTPIPNYANLIHGICTVENLKDVAAQAQLTITEYLVALLIYTFYKCADKPVTKPISVSVPIDLRRRFESKSVRNFVFMSDVSFSPNGRTDCTFEDICNGIRGELRKKASRETLLNAISANTTARSSKLLSPIPYPIKRVFLKNTYKKSQSSYTAFFTNLGCVSLPPELGKHILRAEAVLGSTPYIHFGCAAISINGLMNFTFSSGNKDKEKQLFFFRFLTQHGVRLRIESNDDYI